MTQPSEQNLCAVFRGRVKAASLFQLWLVQHGILTPRRNLLTRLLWRLLRKRRFHLSVGAPDNAGITGRFAEFADVDAVREVFIEKVYDFDAVTPPPDCIIDAGAHIGAFSILASRRFPQARVVSFEPDPQNFALLQKNLTHNGIRAEAHACALGESDTKGRLAGPSSMGRRLGDTGCPVTVRRLTGIVDFSTVSRLLMKIDVEGGEWAVLAECGGALPRSTFIFIETHEGDAGLSRLGRFADEHGFLLQHTKAKGEYHESVLRRGEFARQDAPLRAR